MIIIDTEYTTWPGALESGWSRPGEHREIIQIGAIKVEEDFTEIGSLNCFVIPRINRLLSPLTMTLTGIRQHDIEAFGVTFGHALDKVMDFTHGAPIICMNMDGKVFAENCEINEVANPLPPFHRLRPFLDACAVPPRIASGDLHRLTDTPLEGHTHNALHDVRSMANWLAYVTREGRFTGLDALPTDLPERDHRSPA